MADMLRAYAKSAQAVEYLITGRGRIKERLLEACQDGFVHIDREALPNDLKSVYDQIRDLVVDRSPPPRGAYVRAVEKLSEAEAQRAARLRLRHIRRGSEMRVGVVTSLGTEG